MALSSLRCESAVDPTITHYDASEQSAQHVSQAVYIQR